MATTTKKKRSVSPLKLEADKANEIARAAREKAVQTKLPKDIEAADNLEKAAALAVKKAARDRFERVAGARGTAAITSLRALTKVARGGSRYLFGADDVAALFNEIDAAAKEAREAFEHAVTSELQLSGSRAVKPRVAFAPMAL